MNRITTFCLAIVLVLLSAQIQVSAASLCSGSLTGSFLGESWRKAKWRNGLHPFRYYNGAAVERAASDPDLNSLAVRWIQLNDSPEADARFMDITYQYLIFLADARIKFDIPVGGFPSQPKPMLDLLQTLLDAYEAKIDTRFLITEIDAFLREFVHLDMGIDESRKQEALKWFDTRVLPSHTILSAFLNFHSP